MDAATLRITLSMIGYDMTGAAFGSLADSLLRIVSLMAQLQTGTGTAASTLAMFIPAILGAGAAFGIFAAGAGYAITAGAALQNAGTMASIAISDGAKHVNELENAIVNLANTSQYKIADVDMAFRVLGGLGFDTGQILGGLGEQAIILAQAMGGPGAGISAADAAQLLGQAIYIFGQRGLTAKQAADELTGAFYNNMMSVSSLTEFLGMAGGTASSLGVSFGSLLTFGSMLTPMFGSASSAGASLSYMMRNLAHPATTAMADEIQKLGLHVYDSQGKFVGLKNIMDQLFQDTAHMTQQQKMDVFGTLFNVRSGRAAMDLMSETQSQFDKMYSRVNGRIMQVGQAQRDSNAVNNTAIGTWNRLQTTLNDFFAKAGVFIDQFLIPLGNALNHVLSILQQNSGFEKWLAAFLVAGTVIGAVTTVLLVLIVVIGLFGGAVLIVGAAFIGVVIAAAVVATVFMLIATHTKQIGEAWNWLKGVAGEVWNWIYTHLVQIITGIKDQFLMLVAHVRQTWSQIQTDVSNFLNGIQNLVSTIIGNVRQTFETDIHAVGDLFGWLYNHNYYWHDLVNDIRTLVAALMNFLKAAWDTIKVDAIYAWTAVKSFVEITWAAIKSDVTTAINTVKNIISAVWGFITTATGDAWNRVGTTISNAWNTIKGIVQTNINNVLHLLRDVLGSELFQAGLHLMEMLANGIKNGIGAVLGAAKNVASGIAGLLGFHSPTEEGPGSTSDQWMPALMNMLTNGIEQGIPQLQGAVNKAAGTFGALAPGNLATPGIVGAQGAYAQGQGQPQQFTVNMQVDDKTLAQTFFEVVNGQMRQSGYSRTNR